ncbi:MAG: LysR family transcriptional regulator, partial [Oscillochloris sp.]|nr:LysR family transcriptional regulator [Oscillochloris sp.]
MWAGARSEARRGRPAPWGVTQPAVSTQIARLEETIGFALFERSGGRLKPTPEGMLFYAEATRVLGEVDRLRNPLGNDLRSMVLGADSPRGPPGAAHPAPDP